MKRLFIFVILLVSCTGCIYYPPYDYYDSISMEEFCKTRGGQPFKVYDETQSGQWITCYNYKQVPPHTHR